VRVIAWVRRFIVNSRGISKNLASNVSYNECGAAAITILRLVQREQFPTDSLNINGLAVEKNDDELHCVKTKLIFKNDTESFRRPLLLPADHPLVVSLIRFEKSPCRSTVSDESSQGEILDFEVQKDN